MELTKMTEEKKKDHSYRNRVLIDLNASRVEIETTDANLQETLNVADYIVRSLGSSSIIRGEDIEEKKKRCGIN